MASLTDQEYAQIKDLANQALLDLRERLEEFHSAWPEFKITDSTGHRLGLGLVAGHDAADNVWFAALSNGKIDHHYTPALRDAQFILERMKDRIA